MANATKLYDLVVKVGEYQKDGQTKSRYENIGSVMRNENGQFMMLKRTFNPAGVPGDSSRDSVLISMFEPRGHQGQSSQQSGQSGYGGGGQQGGYDQSPQGGHGGGGRPSGGGSSHGIEEDSIPF